MPGATPTEGRGRRSGSVDVGAHEIEVAVEGDGPPVLLVNGLGGSIATWASLRRELAGMQTIAFDFPGSGGSPRSRLPMSVPGMARMSGRLLDVLGYERVDVVGFSLGGLVAQQLAWRMPDRVGRLVLMSTNVGWASVPGDPRALSMLLSIRRLRDPDYYQAIAPALLGGRMRSDPGLVRSVAQARTNDAPDLQGYIWQLISCASWSTLPFLSRIRQPTLILSGDDDPLARPINARWMARLIPKARLRTIEGGGHHLVAERAGELAAILGEFLLEGGGR